MTGPDAAPSRGRPSARIAEVAFAWDARERPRDIVRDLEVRSPPGQARTTVACLPDGGRLVLRLGSGWLVVIRT